MCDNFHCKTDRAQFFTPSGVAKMCVEILNPKAHESVIDTACGDGVFLSNVCEYLKNQNNRIFGIDLDEKAIQATKSLKLNIKALWLNSLDYQSWLERAADINWQKKYGSEYESLINMRLNINDNKKFMFDIVMTNPPFGLKIKSYSILSNYVLAKKKNINSEILFIERNLNTLKDGGRMAIILPQGILNNSSNKYIREFIIEKARILGVIGLHRKTFELTGTCTKTSAVFIQKYGINNPKLDDYNIFFATQTKSNDESELSDISRAFRDFIKAEKIDF